MKEVNRELLKTVTGGISEGAVIGIAALVIFLIGTFVGYSNPVGCNNK